MVSRSAVASPWRTRSSSSCVNCARNNGSVRRRCPASASISSARRLPRRPPAGRHYDSRPLSGVISREPHRPRSTLMTTAGMVAASSSMRLAILVAAAHVSYSIVWFARDTSRSSLGSRRGAERGVVDGLFLVVQVDLSVFHPVADKGFRSRRMSASLMRRTWPSAYCFRPHRRRTLSNNPAAEAGHSRFQGWRRLSSTSALHT
jgi:hypothetical protein